MSPAVIVKTEPKSLNLVELVLGASSPHSYAEPPECSCFTREASHLAVKSISNFLTWGHRPLGLCPHSSYQTPEAGPP